MLPRNHLPGWMVVVGKGNDHELAAKVDAGLNA